MKPINKDILVLEKIITADQAAELLGCDSAHLWQLLKIGQLSGFLLPDGAVGVRLSSVEALLPRQALPDYQQFSHLQGKRISISDASRKYGIHTSTLTRWMQRGYIAQLGKDGRRTLLDEADVAYCAQVYLSDSGQGKWLFDEKGKPVGDGKRKRGRREPLDT